MPAQFTDFGGLRLSPSYGALAADAARNPPAADVAPNTPAADAVPEILGKELRPGTRVAIILDVETLAEEDNPVPPDTVTALNSITLNHGVVILASKTLTAIDLENNAAYRGIRRRGCLGKKSSLIDAAQKKFDTDKAALNEILGCCDIRGRVVISVDVANRDFEVYNHMKSAEFFMADVVDADVGRSASDYERRFDVYGRDGCAALLQSVAEDWR